jgi:DNA modification methylase
MNEGLTDEDEVPEVTEATCKLGDLWILGNHRLLCGDSTDKEQVEKLMDGEKADMVFTDPPYGVDYDGGVIHGSEINTDHKREVLKNDCDLDLYRKWLPLVGDFIGDGAIYIFYATRNSYHIFEPLISNGFDLHAVIAWVKINTGYADMNSHYKNRYEPCVYAKKKGGKLNFVGATTENTVWEIEKDRNNKFHPTQKPVAVPERAIGNSSNAGGIVLDYFLGSGSTLIACEKTNRKCYGLELDPHYCDVIIKRWEDYTGESAVLDAG